MVIVRNDKPKDTLTRARYGSGETIRSWVVKDRRDARFPFIQRRESINSHSLNILP
jgi:hypothetical protein